MKDSQKFYSSLIRKRGIGRASGFSPAGRISRYNAILNLMHPYPCTVLDVGCGTGGLRTHAGCKFSSYVGIDREPLFIEFAGQRAATAANFYPGTLLGTHLYGALACCQFDYVVASGLFCWECDRHWHAETIHRMWNLATKGIVFNVLSALGPPPDRNGHAVYSLAVIQSALLSLRAHSFKIVQGYHRGNDMTVAVYK